MRHDVGCTARDGLCACCEAQVFRRQFGVLNEEEFALLAGVTVETIGEWRGDNSGPSYTKLGRTVFYRNEDVTAWIKLRTVQLHDNLAPWHFRPTPEGLKRDKFYDPLAPLMLDPSFGKLRENGSY